MLNTKLARKLSLNYRKVTFKNNVFNINGCPLYCALAERKTTRQNLSTAEVKHNWSTTWKQIISM